MRGALNPKTLSVLALALAAIVPGSAMAAVMTAFPNVPLTAAGYTFTLGSGAAGFTFTAADTGYGPGAMVSTTGNGKVSTLFGGVADFESGSSIDQSGELYTFAAYPATMSGLIPYSAADDFIGLAFSQAGAVHYGYAEVNGAQLVSYGYETAADTSILTGAQQVAAVPEPATWGMIILGMGAIGFAMRRRKVSTQVRFA